KTRICFVLYIILTLPIHSHIKVKIMRSTLTFIAALLFMGLAACNNSGKNNNSGTSADNSQMEEMNQNNAESQGEKALPPVPADAKVFFKNLKDGQTVSSPFKVEMGAEGITVEPSGEIKEGF